MSCICMSACIGIVMGYHGISMGYHGISMDIIGIIGPTLWSHKGDTVYFIYHSLEALGRLWCYHQRRRSRRRRLRKGSGRRSTSNQGSQAWWERVPRIMEGYIVCELLISCSANCWTWNNAFSSVILVINSHHGTFRVLNALRAEHWWSLWGFQCSSKFFGRNILEHVYTHIHDIYNILSLYMQYICCNIYCRPDHIFEIDSMR